MRIFIADTSPVTHGRLTDSLSQSRESIIVASAYDAMEAANRVKPDMAVLSPRIASGGEIELVVLMADATPEIRRAFLEAGADFCPDEVTEYDYEYD
jgi:DNA-binding NarL/FixJ family response regulator